MKEFEWMDIWKIFSNIHNQEKEKQSTKNLYVYAHPKFSHLRQDFSSMSSMDFQKTNTPITFMEDQTFKK